MAIKQSFIIEDPTGENGTITVTETTTGIPAMPDGILIKVRTGLPDEHTVRIVPQVAEDLITVFQELIGEIKAKEADSMNAKIEATRLRTSAFPDDK